MRNAKCETGNPPVRVGVRRTISNLGVRRQERGKEYWNDGMLENGAEGLMARWRFEVGGELSSYP